MVSSIWSYNCSKCFLSVLASSLQEEPDQAVSDLQPHAGWNQSHLSWRTVPGGHFQDHQSWCRWLLEEIFWRKVSFTLFWPLLLLHWVDTPLCGRLNYVIKRSCHQDLNDVSVWMFPVFSSPGYYHFPDGSNMCFLFLNIMTWGRDALMLELLQERCDRLSHWALITHAHMQRAEGNCCV